MKQSNRWMGLTGVVWVALALGACSPALDWRTVRPEASGALRAVFPCKPDRLDRSLQLPGLPGPPVVVHLLSCKAGDATWALSYLEAGEVTRVSAAMAAMTQSMRDNLTALAGQGASSPPPPTMVGEDMGAANIAGMTPNPLAKRWRFVVQRPRGEGRVEPMEVQSWHFSHGLTVYQASVWRPLPPKGVTDLSDAPETFAAGLQF